MQDFRSMQAGIGGGGGAGRIFGGGERRFRPYPNQALKCPRCESLNTKFCYYNNYNLSQPRHFCKSCRRYWTKGGVLRNVPVGGGCRKTKRSKPKSTQQDKKSNASHSSSESSSLTNTEGPAPGPGPGPAPAPAPGGSGGGFLNTFADSSRYFVNETQIPTEFQTSMLDDGGGGGGMFGESNGSFTSLMTVSNPSLFGYNFGEVSPFRFQQHQQEDVRLDEEKMASMIGVEEEMKMQELATAAAGGVGVGGVDQRVPVDFPGMEDNRTSNGELTALDWQGSGGGGDQGLFDLPGSVDDQGYWSQSQWTDNDQHLYLPP